MLNKNKLDKKKRILFKKNEIKLNLYKTLLISLKKNKKLIIHTNKKNKFTKEAIKSNLYFQLKYYLLNNINNLNKNSFITKISNRCLWTGRSKSTLSKFKMSRITFKKFVSNNEIPGYFKYSW